MPAILAVIVCTIQWFMIGYTLTYGEGGAIFGDFKYAFHRDVLAEPVGTIPAVLFSFFQLVFQATVCAIAVGGACERGRLLPLVPFIFVSLRMNELISDANLCISYGLRSSTIPWHTWFGVVGFSWILESLILLEAHQYISTLVQQQRRCRSTSRTRSSAVGNLQLVHRHIWSYTAQSIHCVS